MDEFNDRLERLSELSPEELDALIAEMVAAFDAADAGGDLELMQKIADSLDEARSRQDSINEGDTGTTVSPEAEGSISAAGSDADAAPDEENTDSPDETSTDDNDAPAEETADPETSDEAEGDADNADEAEVPAEGEESPDQTQVNAEDEEPAGDASPELNDEAPTTGDAPAQEDPVAKITAEDVPADSQPVAAGGAAVTIRAGGDIPGVTAGTTLDNIDDVIDAMTKKVNSMRGVRGDGEHVVVASLKFDDELPDKQTLRPGDADGNSRKIREFLSNRDQLTPEALTAAGWCAPRTPIYDIPTSGTTDRPVRDSLPSFAADRGGISWVQPPALPDLAGSVGIWRYDDEDGWGSFGNPTGSGSAGEIKPCLTVECGDEQSVDLEPITQCLCFDNMTARAFPEWIRGNTDLSLVAQARFAEQVLLSKLFAASGAATCGSPSTLLGAARDFLTTVKVSAASHRWRFRLGADAPLQLLAPSWLREAITLDLSIQAPGDDKLSISRSEVEGYLADANIDPIWYIDDAPSTDTFDTCVGFPTTANWLLFPTGSFLRIDGGTLDLGVVRTKEDVQKNTYCQFAETFESVAYMGPASPNGWVLHGETPINVIGGSACCIDVEVGS